MDGEKELAVPARPASETESLSQPENAGATVPPSAPGQAPAVPDGGLQAWLVVFGSMVVLFHTWGIVNSFGVYQTYYETVLLTSSSSSDISWIGSLQAALLLMGGIVSGPLYDAGYFRHLLFAGNFLVILGMFMTSLCTQYYQAVLAQGICVGLGCAVMFLPSAAIISQYFAKRRALAIGISSAGSPIAGMVLPIIFGRLEPRIGFGWVTRIIAFILLALAAIPLASMRTRVPASPRKRAFLDRTAVTDGPFLLFTAASFFAFMGLYVPFFYVQLYSIEHGVSSVDFSPYFVTLLNAGSVVGRLVPNYLADKLGALNVLIVVTFLSAALAFAWMGITSFGGLVAFSLLYGAFSGGVVSLSPSAIVPLCPDMSLLGTRMGMSFFFAGLSVLVGTPIGGAILGRGGDGAWRGIISYAAATQLLASALMLVAQILHLRRAKAAKA